MELPTVEWTNEELITGLKHIAHTMERNGHSYYQHVAEDAIKTVVDICAHSIGASVSEGTSNQQKGER